MNFNTQTLRSNLHRTTEAVKHHAEVNKYRLWTFFGVAILLPYADNAVAKILGAPLSQERISVIILAIAFPFLHIRGRVAIVLAIITILTLPVLFVAKKLGAAEQMAITTYELLVIGFFWSFVELFAKRYREKLIG